MTTDDKPFTGFSDPTQNWSRLPHQLIAALPLISSLGEMKVILYVLRHTWGYHDDDKRISTDEFCNGRKHSFRYKQKHPDESDRLDNGTGMSKSAILRGIERAIEHGFLEVEVDDSDKGRIKKYYRLIQADDLHPEVSKRDMSQTNTPRATKQDITAPESIHQSKKETIERNLEKEPPPSAISHSGPLSDLDDTETTFIHPDGTTTTYHGGTFDADGNPNLPPPFTGTPAADLDELWPDDRPPTQPAQPHSAEQVKAGIRKALETFSSTGGRAGVADPTKSEWANTDLMMAFSFVTGTPWDEVKPSSLKDWPSQFEEWAATWKERAPSVDDTIKCVRGIMDSEHNWKTWTSPRSPSFQEVLDIMLGRYRAWRPWHKDGKKNGGASANRSVTDTSDIDPKKLAAYNARLKQQRPPPVLGPAETDWLSDG